MSEEFECEHLDIFCVKRRIGSGHCTSPGKCIKADEIADKLTVTQQAGRIQELEARIKELESM